ncbi:MAG: DHH family phosphoesterase [Clostridia bacterium]|nr:DHH family phosphoesterase [Clostridia bacterium]
MQKQSENRRRQGVAIPMIVLLALGILFFGVYVAAAQFSSTALNARVALIFLGAYLAFGLLACLFFLLKEHKQRGEEILFESLNTKMHNMFKYAVGLPYAIVDEQGRVRTLNSALQKILGADDPFYRGTVSDFSGGVSLQEIIRAGIGGEDARTELGKLTMETIAAKEDDAKTPTETLPPSSIDGTIVRLPDNGRYVARAYAIMLHDRIGYLVTFTDASELLDLREKMERDMPAVAYIDVDNLEELTQYTHANYRDASRKVDDVLIGWAADMNGFLREYERDRYIMFFSQEKLRLCEEDKFSTLLDRIREIRLGEYGIPVTVSIGISLDDCNMAERAAQANSALDMALQRGGDQVAVRRRDGIRYYGGQTRPSQRRSRVQSRVVASYLLTKISVADNLLIMGHKNPDFDSIGACVGIAQLGLLAGIPTKIIMDLDNASFRIATERLAASHAYSDIFISGHRGLDLIRSGTLLIIVDANNFRIIESPEVANSVRQVSGKIAIIDHHRQAGEYDFEPVVNYIDPSASSATELVAEMLEQSETGNESENNKLVSDEVASVMLSGIMLDTNGFTRNTGSRTLDAARYLYGKGANAEYVHSFFNQDYADYVCERSFSGCSLMQTNTVGLTWSHGTGRGADDRVAAAKEADRLLNVKGVCASFALVVIDNVVHVSGRSDGSVNVQLILEKLGGGGRFDSAGTALSDVSLETAVEDLRGAIRAYFAEIEDTHHGA